MQVVVGARNSKLSKTQVKEILSELQKVSPQVSFVEKLVSTKGDKDQKTSLLKMDKSDFFTHEIDQMLLKNECDVGIHSAKDLPDPIPDDLEVVAITRGVCSKDCLVLREGESLLTLPKNPKVGTSSLRRIQMIKDLRDDFVAKDIRGDILKRLSLLEKKDIDALVIAHAAIIRLNLKCNKVFLEGETAPLQGQLAIVSRKGDAKMKELFGHLTVDISFGK